MNCVCFFCKENRFCLNEELSLPGIDSIIYENDDVYVTPDLFPLCLGHMLIITKKHYNSLGNVPYSVYESAEKAKCYLRERIFKTMPYISFEHGAVIEHSGGSCIDHAHIHMMPFGEDLKNVIESSDFIDTCAVEASYKSLKHFAEQGIPYIYYQRNSEQPIAYPIFNGLPSQFFRMLIAQKLKINYNWKISYRDGSAKELFNKSIIFGKR